MAEHHRHDSLLADGSYLVGGGCMFASAFLYWITRGPGSGLRGHALVDAVVALGNHVPALSAARLTVLWYLVPALGAGAWVACGLTGPRSRTSRIVAVCALVVSCVMFVAFARLAGAAHLGWGPKLALAGGILLVLGSWVTMSPRARSSVVRAGDS